MDAKTVADMAAPRVAGRGAASGPAVKACLVVIAGHEGEEISVEAIAGLMGGSRSTAARAIRALVAAGIVRVERGEAGVTGRRRYWVREEALGTRH